MGAIEIAVGDVVGHGAAAAATMGQLRAALSAYLLDGASPAVALARLDRFSRRVPEALASSASCAVLDVADDDPLGSPALLAEHGRPAEGGPRRSGRPPVCGTARRRAGGQSRSGSSVTKRCG